LALCQIAQIRWQVNCRHQALTRSIERLLSSQDAGFNALWSRGGEIGRSRIRAPLAAAIAFAIAARGGTIGVSPTPRTP
jgi:hypothetical protein